MKVDISFDGFGDTAKIIESRIQDAIRKGAETVCAAAQSRCPVDTGRLRSSIGVSAEGMEAVISADTEYASYVEFGTSKAAANPYLVPSLLENTEKITAAMAAALTEE